jgi:hypothetical protein
MDIALKKPSGTLNLTYCEHNWEEELEMGKKMPYCYNCDLCGIQVHCKGCKEDYYKKKK